jgi:hypothetical protein
MDASQLLSSYGQSVGLLDLAFDAHGCARLKFTDDVAVNLEVDRACDCVQLYTELGPVPAGPCEDLFREMLEGNLFGTRTRGATLAIDPVQRDLLLCRRVELATADPASFAHALEEFVVAATHWLQVFGSGALCAGSSSEPSMPEIVPLRPDMFLRG